MMNEPILIVGGLFTPAVAYNGWKKRLEAPPYNQKVYLADISSGDWAGTMVERFGPALSAINRAARHALADSGAERLKLVGHSAGGRLARLWLSDTAYPDRGSGAAGWRVTSTVVMLGAANQTAEPWSQKSVGWLNQHYPGAFYPSVKYITVIGRHSFGRFGLSPLENLAAINYWTQDRYSAQWGDTIIPVKCAHLPGATNLVLDGVSHGSYADPKALTQWAHLLTKEKTDG